MPQHACNPPAALAVGRVPHLRCVPVQAPRTRPQTWPGTCRTLPAAHRRWACKGSKLKGPARAHAPAEQLVCLHLTTPTHTPSHHPPCHQLAPPPTHLEAAAGGQVLARLPVQHLLTCHLRTLAGGGGGIGVGSLARTAVKRVEGQGGEQARSAGYRGVRVWCVLARLHILNPAPSTAQQSPHLYSRSTAASSAARSASTLDPNRSLSNLAKAVARAASCASARAELCTGRCCCSRLRENRGVGRVGIGCCAVHECLLVQLLHARKPCAQSEKQAAPKHARVAPPADVHILARLHQLAVEVLHQAAGCSQTARVAMPGRWNAIAGVESRCITSCPPCHTPTKPTPHQWGCRGRSAPPPRAG